MRVRERTVTRMQHTCAHAAAAAENDFAPLFFSLSLSRTVYSRTSIGLRRDVALYSKLPLLPTPSQRSAG